jgi:hypothetical protein
MTTALHEELANFKRNSKAYAEHWLQTGARHPAEHHIITRRLDPWRKAVEQAGLREELAGEVAPTPMTLPAKPRIWIMPSAGPGPGLGADLDTGLGAAETDQSTALPSQKSPAEPAECCDSAGMVDDGGGAVTGAPGAGTRFCRVCLKPFEAKRAEARFCSPACRQQASRQQRRGQEVA